MSGLQPKSLMFLRGTDFDPPRAGMIASMLSRSLMGSPTGLQFAWAVISREYTEVVAVCARRRSVGQWVDDLESARLAGNHCLGNTRDPLGHALTRSAIAIV